MMNVSEGGLTETHFSIYGKPLRVMTASTYILEPVNELLKYFTCEGQDREDGLMMVFHAVGTREEIPIVIATSAVQMASGTGAATAERPATGLAYEVWKEGDRLIVDFHHAGIMQLDPAKGWAIGYLVRPDELPSNLVEYLFHTAMIELLRYRGLYTVHATSLEMHGRGILIPGNSGRGKTTSFVSLLRAGYRYISDDHPLLEDAGTHVDVLPFPMQIKVTENTANFFPELREAPAHLFRPGMGKRLFKAEDVYKTEIGQRCKPAIVLFPNVVDSPKSHLELLPKSRALEVLLPQALLVYDRAVAAKQFQVMSKLVQQVDCYRLHFGRDVLDLPNLITPLMKKAA
jgi:hypothetical protein